LPSNLSAPPAADTPLTLLTIAGHDPSSGAGVTADLMTFGIHGFWGISAITALTVQSTLGVESVQPVDPAFLRRTLDCLAADTPPAGVKIGMLGNAASVAAVARFLHSQPAGQEPPVVLDPVLRASSGTTLLAPDALSVLHAELLPAVHWITPNWPELAALSGSPSILTQPEAESAMHHLAARHPHLHIVATAGDCAHPTDLLRLPSGELHRFPGEHIASNATHGTGCAFSSSLLAHLVQGKTPVAAVAAAKAFVTEAIRRAPAIGQGKGPLNLLWPRS